MSERQLRVGVIGAGTFAEECHIPGVQAHPRGRVTALCARNRERAAAMAAHFGVPTVYTDYHELLADPNIDAVTVATPDALHLPIVLAALDAGKHVFCEKPLANSADEARQMTHAADRSGLVAMVAFTFRYTRALPELRRLIHEGAIGTPFHVSMQVHWGSLIGPEVPVTWREQSAHSIDGIYADGGSHLFDALAFTLAPVQEVCAQLMVVPRAPGIPQPDNADLATCLGRLNLGSGQPPQGYADRQQGAVQVSILISRVDEPYGASDIMQVLGTEGAIQVPFTRGANEYLRLIRSGQSAWEEHALPADANTGQPLALTRMMGAFVDAAFRGTLDPDRDPGFAAGLHTQLALDAGSRSARSGCWERVDPV